MGTRWQQPATKQQHRNNQKQCSVKAAIAVEVV